MTLKQALRRICRYLAYFLIFTFPFYFQALVAGWLFGKFHSDNTFYKGPELFIREFDSFSWMDQWSVPGAPTIWEHQDNTHPFFVPQLRSNTWHNKLGLTIPNSHKENFDIDAPIEKLVGFEGAARDVSCHYGHPTEFWIYVSSLSMPAVFEWDQTFVELLEYHEKYPLPGNTSFAHIDCAASPFLCHCWQVQYPALMHFKIDEAGEVADDVDPSAFKSPMESLRPIEVRHFDLGLQLETSPLPNGIFPSRLEQMKALTTKPGALDIEEPYDGIQRAYRQFNELYYYPAVSEDGSFLDYSSEFDYFLLKKVAAPLGLQEVAEMLSMVAFLSSFALSALFYLPVYHVKAFWEAFSGKRTDLDYLMDRMDEREAYKSQGGLMGDMFGGFMDYVKADMEEQKASKARRARQYDDGLTPEERTKQGVPPPEITGDPEKMGKWLSDLLADMLQNTPSDEEYYSNYFEGMRSEASEKDEASEMAEASEATRTG